MMLFDPDKGVVSMFRTETVYRDEVESTCGNGIMMELIEP